MNPALWKIHRHRQVLVGLPWLTLIVLLVVANWRAYGSYDLWIEAGLVAYAARLALTLRRSTAREDMEYLGQLPLPAAEVASSPFRAAVAQLVLVAVVVHIVESSGAAFLFGPGLHDYHHRPLYPWVNLVGYPFLTFQLVTYISISSKLAVSRTTSSYIGVSAAIALGLLVCALYVLLVGMGSPRLRSVAQYPVSPLYLAVPGFLCIVLGVLLFRHQRIMLMRHGLDYFPPGEEAWQQ
jgi:hypothetical protein